MNAFNLGFILLHTCSTEIKIRFFILRHAVAYRMAYPDLKATHQSKMGSFKLQIGSMCQMPNKTKENMSQQFNIMKSLSILSKISFISLYFHIIMQPHDSFLAGKLKKKKQKTPALNGPMLIDFSCQESVFTFISQTRLQYEIT